MPKPACAAIASNMVDLPVPFSPVIRTLASEGATREINSITGRMRGESEMIFGILPRSSSFFDKVKAFFEG